MGRWAQQQRRGGGGNALSQVCAVMLTCTTSDGETLTLSWSKDVNSADYTTADLAIESGAANVTGISNISGSVWQITLDAELPAVDQLDLLTFHPPVCSTGDVPIVFV